MSKRIAIVGSRNYPHLVDVRSYIDTLTPDTIIVSGGAPGVDRVAEEYGLERGHIVIVVKAAWRPRGVFDRAAGHKRNPIIVDLAHEVVAFYDGSSPGTAGTIEYARKVGKPITVIECEER